MAKAPQIVDVLVPLALDQAYSYRVPAGMTLAPGDVVDVPLGQAEYTGVVWGEAIRARACTTGSRISRPSSTSRRCEPLRDFVDWVSDYTLGARGMVLRMTLRMGEHLGPARERVGVRLAGPRRSA